MVLPKEVPVMTISNATLFPQALLPLHIFEPRYRKMLADALRTHRMFSVAMQKPGRSRETPCTVAGLGLIRVSVDHQDGTSHLILQGLSRIELGPPKRYRPYRVHPIKVLESSPPSTLQVEALVAKVHELVEQRIKMGAFPLPFPLLEEGETAKTNWNKAASKFTVNEIMSYLRSLTDADQTADLVSCALLPRAADRQSILEAVQIEERLQQLIHFLMAEIRRNRKYHKK
jgi:Lon protease-like protein